MKYYMKNKVFFLFFLFFFGLSLVEANHINSIDMDIYIDKYGNANVKEIWDVYLDSGTEGYRNYTLTDNISISNFSVVDDTGRKYKSLEMWDTLSSFYMKSYSSGINEIYGGVELCWGISQYGDRKYMLEYTINNFVNQYKDNQGIYLNLLNLDQTVDKVNIKISSDTLFSLDNTRIWGFGYKGDVIFDDGSIIMKTSNKLKDNQYMVLLARFDKNIFNVKTLNNKSFDDVYNDAVESVSFKEKVKDFIYENESFRVIAFVIICFLFFLLNPITLFIIFLMFRKNKKKRFFLRRCPYINLNFGIDGRKMPLDNEINYFRDIPCNKNLFYAYWVSFQYSLISLEQLREGIIGAILLKWIDEEKIKIIKTKRKFLSFRDNNYEIDLGDNINVSNYSEYELYLMLKNSVNEGRYLRAKKFSKWCSENYDIVELWFRNIIGYTNFELEKMGLITNEISNNISYRRLLCKNVNILMKEEAIKLQGLRKYLLDFSLMSQKEYFDVQLWNEYLIFAMLLGIADKVEEQFEKMYPKFKELSVLKNKETMILIRDISHNSYSNFVKTRNRVLTADYSGDSRMSGSGGSSYSSGGGSSGGSSGGGFR